MKSNRNAFTLIELMIVCAIIAVLAALLFAGLGPVREHSRRTVCLSNLQQIGHAIAMYRADYDGIDPSVGCTLTAEQIGIPTDSSPIIDAYVKNKSVLICPDYVQKPGFALITSYGYGYIDRYRFTAELKKRGMETITMTCEDHNRLFDLENEPRWVTQHVQFLRLDGTVVSKEVPISDLDFTNW